MRIKSSGRMWSGPAVTLVALALAAPAWAGHHVVKIAPPSGGDDTAVLQQALDECVASGPGCTVQLSAGTYRTRQLVAYDLHGHVKGAGKGVTTLKPAGTLPVTDPICLRPPNTEDCLWPDLMIFVDGSVRLSDLSIVLDVLPATTPYNLIPSIPDWKFTVLVSGIRVMGGESEQPMTLSVERISVKGVADPTSLWGVGPVNCIIAAGELPRPGIDPGNFNPGVDEYPLSGVFSYTANDFEACDSAVGMQFVTGSRVTVGGAPSKGNTATDVGFGYAFMQFEGSIVEVSHSTASARWADVVASDSFYPSQVPSYYSIHDNDFEALAPWADGIWLLDNAEGPKVRSAAIVNNKVKGVDAPGGGLIHVINTTGTVIAANQITGSAAAGIQVDGGNRCMLLGNQTAGFTAREDLAPIVLDAGTSESLVVGSCNPGEVLDLGHDNRIVCR